MASIPSPIRKWVRRYITGEGSEEIASQSPVQSVNSQTGDVTISTGGGAIPSTQTVTSYSGLPTADLSEAEIWFVTGENDIVASTKLSPVVWRSLSDFTIVAIDIPDSAVAQWTLDNADTESGSALDVWNNNDGTINGATTGASGANQTYTTNEAYNFNNEDDVNFGSDSSLTDPPLSWALWINTNDSSTTTRAMGDISSTPRGSVVFNRGDNRGISVLWGNGTFNELNTNFTISNNTWHHVVYTYSGGAGTVFVDGSQEGQLSAGLSNSSNSLLIGRDPAGFGAPWDGEIDDVRVYGKALTATEVSNLYNNGSI